MALAVLVDGSGDCHLEFTGRDDAIPASDLQALSIADPQARFHNNRVTRDKVSVPAWKRQVKAKLRPLRAEIERAKAEAEAEAAAAAVAVARAKAEQTKKE